MDTHNKNGFILYVLNILKKYSDENHILSSNRIVELIKEEYNETIDKKTVVNYIKLLTNKFHYDIDMFQNNKKGYYLKEGLDTDFTLGELSAIINTFAYSNFIPEIMSNNITDKCLNMMNIYEREKYKDYKPIMKDTKTDNMQIIKNIEDINEAIYQHKKIKFDYCKYKINNSKLEKDSHPACVSPYKLVYSLQKFYLICKKEDEKILRYYRLDKMLNVEILKKKVDNKVSQKQIDDFIKNNVNMFSGTLIKAEIECDNSILDMVVETYGKDIVLKELPNNKFYASFITTLQGFKYWCLRNIDTVKVLSPEKLINEINELINKK